MNLEIYEKQETEKSKTPVRLQLVRSGEDVVLRTVWEDGYPTANCKVLTIRASGYIEVAKYDNQRFFLSGGSE